MKSSTRLSVLLFLFIVLLAPSLRAQYCLLPGRVPYDALQPGITNFKLNTINRSSGNVENMSKVIVVTSDTTSLIVGQTYTVTMSHTRDSVIFPTTRNNIRVWIDYNKNSSFQDAGETVISSDLKPYGVFTGTFTVPATAPLGMTRLRATAKMSADAGHSLPTPCDTPVADPIGYHGEIEDYFVKIIAPPTSVADVAQGSNNATVYPNPTTGQITVSVERSGGESLSIELLDVTGKVMGRLLNSQKQSSLSYNFDLNNYVSAPGIYIVRVSSQSSTSYQKIVKGN